MTIANTDYIFYLKITGKQLRDESHQKQRTDATKLKALGSRKVLHKYQ